MPTISIQEVVNILKRDEILLRNISSMARRMVSPVCYIQLEPRWTMCTITTDRFLNDVFEDWVRINGKLATIEALCEIVQDMNLILTKELLQDEFKDTMTAQIIPYAKPKTEEAFTENPKIRKRFNNAGSTYKSFTGRTDDLLTLHKKFEERQIAKLVLVSGLGGVGKTELVRTFCNQIFEKHETNCCIWLSADSGESLLSNLKDITNSKLDDAVDLFKDLLGQVQDQKCCLVVFDNVDVKNEHVENIFKKFLDQTSLFFLVTSRNVLMLQAFDPFPLELKVLSLQDAQAFIRATVGITGSEEELAEVKTLCEIVQCYTLALRQSVSYIIEQRKVGSKGKKYSVSHYLKDTSSVQVRADVYGKCDFDYRYHSSVLKTLIVTLKHLNSLDDGEKALKCLRLLSCMRPDDTKLSQLQTFLKCSLGIPESDGEHITKMAIQRLKQFSLIDCENEIVKIHRVVQEIITLNFFAEVLKDFGPVLSDGGITNSAFSFHVQLRNICESIIRMIEFPDHEPEFTIFLKFHYRVILKHGTAQWKEYLKVLKLFKCHFGSYADSSVAWGFRNLLEYVDTETGKQLFQDIWSDYFPTGETLFSQELETELTRIFTLLEGCSKLIVKLNKSEKEVSAAAFWLERGYDLCRSFPEYEFILPTKQRIILHYLMTLLKNKAYEKAFKVVTTGKRLFEKYPAFWGTIVLKPGFHCIKHIEAPKVKEIFDALNPNEAIRIALRKIISSKWDCFTVYIIRELDNTMNEVKQDFKKMVTIDEDLVVELTKLVENLRTRLPQKGKHELDGLLDRLLNNWNCTCPEDNFFEAFGLLNRFGILID